MTLIAAFFALLLVAPSLVRLARLVKRQRRKG
jgi:hypothetical protein